MQLRDACRLCEKFCFKTNLFVAWNILMWVVGLRQVYVLISDNMMMMMCDSLLYSLTPILLLGDDASTVLMPSSATKANLNVITLSLHF